MRLSSAAHTSLPWRIHELTTDFRLEDVWALPTPGGPDDFPRLVRQMTSGYQESDDPRVFLLYERYTDEEAFQAHRRTSPFRDIIERQVVPLLDERAWTRMEPLPA